MKKGDILGGIYEIREQIGQGGGGTIYKAWHKRLGKEVVLKKIHYSTSHNEEEKEILKNLKHSYLPQVFDFLDVEDGVFTVIDYIPGQSLEKVLQDRQRCSQKSVVKYAIQLCEVVDYLHRQKPPIIHGDIKPANIMLTPEDDICLIDFNISGVLDGKSMAVQGYTPGYASPEQTAAVIAAIEAEEKRAGENTTVVSGKKTAEDGEATEILPENRQRDDEATLLLPENRQTDGDTAPTLQMFQNRMNGDAAEVTHHNGGSVPRQEEDISRTELSEKTVAHKRGPDTVRAGILSQPVDARSDIYSIAATLYHLLTGVMPDSDPEKIKSPSELDDRIGEGLSVVLMKALSRDPKDRFQTAGALLRAFREVYRYDRKYKRLILRQELTLLAFVACVGLGILMVFFGRKEREAEEEEAYVQTIALLEDAMAERDSGKVEALYEEASGMKPERLEAYFQRAYYLYQNRDYEICRDFIEGTILSEAGWTDDARMADVYFLLANCYFEQEQYDRAIVDYRTAILRNEENPEYYRDYAIALVRVNKLEEAETVLQTARMKGVSSVDLLLVEGELQNAGGKYEEAENALKRCISETDDDYIRMRAYVICDMVYRNMNEKYAAVSEGNGETDTEYLEKSRALLEEARTKVGLEYQLLIYERLAQTYIDLDELTADHTYGQSAVSVLQDIIAHGWGSYITYNNISILYQKMGDLDQAGTVLQQMVGLYPDNYNTYKRLAFLEVEIQKQKENGQRRYDDFLKYYETAKELYEKDPPAGGDAEMQLLDGLRQQLTDGGWL